MTLSNARPLQRFQEPKAEPERLMFAQTFQDSLGCLLIKTFPDWRGPEGPRTFSRWDRKAHKLFQHKRFGPHPKHPILPPPPPKKNLCASFPKKGRKKGAHLNFFGGNFGVKKGVPNRPFSAAKSSVYCFFPALIFESFSRLLRFGPGDSGSPKSGGDPDQLVEQTTVCM